MQCKVKGPRQRPLSWRSRCSTLFEKQVRGNPDDTKGAQFSWEDRFRIIGCLEGVIGFLDLFQSERVGLLLSYLRGKLPHSCNRDALTRFCYQADHVDEILKRPSKRIAPKKRISIVSTGRLSLPKSTVPPVLHSTEKMAGKKHWAVRGVQRGR